MDLPECCSATPAACTVLIQPPVCSVLWGPNQTAAAELRAQGSEGAVSRAWPFLGCQQPGVRSLLMALSPSLLFFSEISSLTTFYWMSTVSARCLAVLHVSKSSGDRRHRLQSWCHRLVLCSLPQPESSIIPSLCASCCLLL